MAEPDTPMECLLRAEPYLYRVGAPFEKLVKCPLYINAAKIELGAMQFVRLRYENGELFVYVLGLS
jgi:hypothetical protein